MKNKKSSAILNTIMSIVWYLLAIAVAVIFSLYLSAKMGWVFVFVMAIAPVFSIVITAIIKKLNCIIFSADLSNSMIYKRETLILKVKVKNKSILPIPVLLIQIYSPAVLKCLENEKGLYAVTVPPRSEVTFEVKYKANYWGKCVVGIKSIKLQDFMRFGMFNILNENTSDKYTETVKIFPDIPDVPSDSPLVHTVAEDVQFYDDSEETKESDGLSIFAGNPGYTHRDYVEGDPIKRINWKLSSKRDSLMVRLDDEIDSMQQNIILDGAAGDNVYDNEKAVEGVLAICFSLVRLGFETVVWYKQDGHFVNRIIESQTDVVALQTSFADYSFENIMSNSSRLPDISDLTSKPLSVLIYTALADGSFRAAVSAFNNSGLHTSIVTSDSISAVHLDNVWKLNNDFSAEKIS